jgi:TetR/AcrR family fatty acid metabolism transcriptional regulator
VKRSQSLPDSVSEHGDRAASITRIARRAGVVEGTIYKHFRSKQDLLFRVIEEFYEPLIHDVENGVRAIHGSANRLRFIIGRHLQAFGANRGLCRLLIREIRPDGTLYRSAIMELNRRYTRAALQTLQEGVESGEFRAEITPATVRNLIYGAIEHVVWRFVFRGGRLDADRVADDLTHTVLHGIVALPETTQWTVNRLAARVAGLERRIDRGDQRRRSSTRVPRQMPRSA